MRSLAVALILGAIACGAPESNDRAVDNTHPVHLVRPRVAPLSEMALLGRDVFRDTTLSASGRRSCASCHSASNAYAPTSRARAVVGTSVMRAVPSLRYADRAPPFGSGPEVSDVDDTTRVTPPTKTARGGLFWDGRANTLQDQAMGPLFNPNEMGNRNAVAVRDRLRRAPYAQRFVTLFGPGVFSDPARLVDEAMFAVARYQIEDSTFHPYDSKYDAFLEGRAPLSPAEWRGLQAFEDPKRGNCAACHLDRARGDGLPPVFTDYEYEALGVPHDPAQGTSATDLGACGPVRTDLRGQTQYCGLFRTPSLRNTATRYAFFHNGVYSTLEQVLAFYNLRSMHPSRVYSTGSTLPDAYRANLDTTDAPFDRRRGDRPPMSDQDMRDIIAFLQTLTDGYRPPSRR